MASRKYTPVTPKMPTSTYGSDGTEGTFIRFQRNYVIRDMPVGPTPSDLQFVHRESATMRPLSRINARLQRASQSH
jgi:hypothetical protein